MLEITLEIIGFIIGGIVLAACVRKWGAHTLINGWMSKEQADAVFPDWRPKNKQSDNSKES